MAHTLRTLFREVVEKREFYRMAEREWLIHGHQPSWMPAEQWRQLRDYAAGREIPTDPEVINALCHPDNHAPDGTLPRFVYAVFANGLIEPQNYAVWCDLIRTEQQLDVFRMDIGL